MGRAGSGLAGSNGVGSDGADAGGDSVYPKTACTRNPVGASEPLVWAEAVTPQARLMTSQTSSANVFLFLINF